MLKNRDWRPGRDETTFTLHHGLSRDLQMAFILNNVPSVLLRAMFIVVNSKVAVSTHIPGQYRHTLEVCQGAFRPYTGSTGFIVKDWCFVEIEKVISFSVPHWLLGTLNSARQTRKNDESKQSGSWNRESDKPSWNQVYLLPLPRTSHTTCLYGTWHAYLPHKIPSWKRFSFTIQTTEKDWNRGPGNSAGMLIVITDTENSKT